MCVHISLTINSVLIILIGKLLSMLYYVLFITDDWIHQCYSTILYRTNKNRTRTFSLIVVYCALRQVQRKAVWLYMNIMVKDFSTWKAYKNRKVSYLSNLGSLLYVILVLFAAGTPNDTFLAVFCLSHQIWIRGEQCFFHWTQNNRALTYQSLLIYQRWRDGIVRLQQWPCYL